MVNSPSTRNVVGLVRDSGEVSTKHPPKSSQKLAVPSPSELYPRSEASHNLFLRSVRVSGSIKLGSSSNPNSFIAFISLALGGLI